MPIEIKKYKPSSHKVKAVIYGASGAGKTTFGSSAPNPIYASAEGGLLSIADKNVDYVEIKTLNDLSDLHEYLSKNDHSFETLIIDSITEINDIIKIEIEKKTGKQMSIKDWGTLAKKLKAILRQFRDLNMHVLFICQEKVEKDEDKIYKILPSLNGKADTEIAYFMDIVGYLYIDKKGDRQLITSPDSRLLTKDRTNKIGNDTKIDLGEWINITKNIEIKEEPKKETPVKVKEEVEEKPKQEPEKEEGQKEDNEPNEEATVEQASEIFENYKKQLQTYVLQKIGYKKGDDPKKTIDNSNKYLCEKLNIKNVSLKDISNEVAKEYLDKLTNEAIEELIAPIEKSDIEVKIDKAKTVKDLEDLKDEIRAIKLKDKELYQGILEKWLNKRSSI